MQAHAPAGVAAEVNGQPITYDKLEKDLPHANTPAGS